MQIAQRCFDGRQLYKTISELGGDGIASASFTYSASWLYQTLSMRQLIGSNVHLSMQGVCRTSSIFTGSDRLTYSSKTTAVQPLSAAQY